MNETQWLRDIVAQAARIKQQCREACENVSDSAVVTKIRSVEANAIFMGAWADLAIDAIEASRT